MSTRILEEIWGNFHSREKLMLLRKPEIVENISNKHNKVSQASNWFVFKISLNIPTDWAFIIQKFKYESVEYKHDTTNDTFWCFNIYKLCFIHKIIKEIIWRYLYVLDARYIWNFNECLHLDIRSNILKSNTSVLCVLDEEHLSYI